MSDSESDSSADEDYIPEGMTYCINLFNILRVHRLATGATSQPKLLDPEHSSDINIKMLLRYAYVMPKATVFIPHSVL